MRVVQVTPRYEPHSGGVETHVKEISERLVERGHDVIVFTADAERGLNKLGTRNGVIVRRFTSMPPNRGFHAAPQIAVAVRRADADVIHAHNYHSLPLIFSACGVIGRKFVVTPHYHGESPSSIRNQLLSLYRPLGGRALQKADELIAVSDWERSQLCKDFGIDARVIPNGIDVERFADAEPEVRERPYLLSVGRLEEYKGVQHIIGALNFLPGYDLVVAGSGPYRAALERKARVEGVADRVSFTGYVADSRLPGLYAGAAVVVNLSRIEAYGLTVGEALAAGTPVVVRSGTGLNHWTEFDACLAVSDVTPPTLSAAIERVQGRTVERTPLGWNEIVLKIESLYQA